MTTHLAAQLYLIRYRRAENFRGKKLSQISWICAVPQSYLREFLGVWHTLKGCGTFLHMRTQGVVSRSTIQDGVAVVFQGSKSSLI